MTSQTITSFPDAPASIQAAIDAGILKSGSWGDGNDAVCMMSAIVKGAYDVEDCAAAGWPEWLAALNVSLFDANVGVEDEGKARAQFALDLTMATAKPFDAEAARTRFLIARLDTGDHSALKSLRLKAVDADWWRDCERAVVTVAGLLRRKLAGEEVAEEMRAAAEAAARAAAYAARAAAYAAAYAARAAAYAAAEAAAEAAADAYAARAAAYAAAYAARAAAYAAAEAAADAYAARAAADAAAHAADAAADAAYAAARRDLISAIKQSRVEK